MLVQSVFFLFFPITCIVSFSYIYNSQGSVATQLRYGGKFNNFFITNFSQSAIVNELVKSVNIWRRYGQKFGGTFVSPTVYVVDAP